MTGQTGEVGRSGGEWRDYVFSVGVRERGTDETLDGMWVLSLTPGDRDSLTARLRSLLNEALSAQS